MPPTSMRIVLQKLSDERHELAIVRENGRRERVECETRSYLVHDLLHYAVETEARLACGFWGNLERGKTLEEMNDRTGRAMEASAPDMAIVERIVGTISGAVKGRSAAEMMTVFRSSASALDSVLPGWLTEDFIAAVQERMRRLMGHWKATPYGESMVLDWPAAPLK